MSTESEPEWGVSSLRLEMAEATLASAKALWTAIDLDGVPWEKVEEDEQQLCAYLASETLRAGMDHLLPQVVEQTASLLGIDLEATHLGRVQPEGR